MATPSRSWNKGNLIRNFDFSDGPIGGLPDGWRAHCPRQSLCPDFRLVRRDGRRALRMVGNGDPDCVGWIGYPLNLPRDRTYRMRVRFKMTPDINPNLNLRLAYIHKYEFNNGIFHFRKLRNGWIEGEDRFPVVWHVPPEGEVHLGFHFSAKGKVWVDRVYLGECEPIPPRWVRVAAVHGRGGLKEWEKVLNTAGREHADLVLLPEFVNGNKPEPLRGPSWRLMSGKAAQYGMYVAGAFIYHDKRANRIYNTCLLFDREGKEAGRYYKNHPWDPETYYDGITPGSDVPVFETDFGKVGMMICYDSWFTDVSELLALKGAEMILFASGGYYKAIIPARAADNGVRVVASSQVGPVAIFDTTGAEVTDPFVDPSRYANPVQTFKAVKRMSVAGIDVLFASLDLSQSPTPHSHGGPFASAPGGRRNRRAQKRWIVRDIAEELERWWEK